ncbi:MAG: hypothetical protein H6605_04905 [Flavobacteriales bacterium]|nr:hypothetical protein [Flavobacteriales bacterium]
MHLRISQNILDGHGHAFLESNPNDLSLTNAKEINFWPPGYSLLLCVFLALGLKGVSAIIFSDALAILLLYLCWYKIIVSLKIENKIPIVVFLFAFFTLGYTPIGTFYSYGTNIWSLLCFSVGILCLVSGYHSNNFSRFRRAFVFFLSCFLCVFFRYAYLPVGLLMCLGYLWMLYKNERLATALKFALIPAILFGGFYLYQSYRQENLNYINSFHPDSEQTIYADNLVKTSAIVSNTFLQPLIYKSTNLFHSLSLFIRDKDKLSAEQVRNGMIKYVFTLLLCFFLFAALFAFYRRGTEILKKTLLFMLILAVLQILFFMGLSLRYPPEIFKGMDGIQTWTYVEEVRYFNAIHLLILITGLFAMYTYKIMFARTILFFCVLFNLSVFSKNLAGKSIHKLDNIRSKNFWILESLPDSLNYKKAVFLEKELTVRPSNYHYVSILFADKGVPTLKNRSGSLIKTSKPITLYMAIDHVEYDEGDAKLKEFIFRNKAAFIGTILHNKVEIYSMKIYPGQKLIL